MCETPTPGNAPKYLKNSATRVDGTVDEFAYTRVDGRRISLGRYGHAEGYQRWKRLLNEWLAAHDLDQAIEPSRVTVADLADRWLDSERSRMDSARISRKTYAEACYAAEAAVLQHAGSLAFSGGGTIGAGIVGAASIAKIAAAIGKCSATGVGIAVCLALLGITTGVVLYLCYGKYNAKMQECFNALSDKFQRQMTAACNGEECQG